MKTTAIILSGGRGLRLGTDIPKQYIEIGGKPILGYTLEAFQNSIVDRIIIVAADDYIDKCWQIARLCDATKVAAVISGGSERYYSVLNGLEFLNRECNDKGKSACNNSNSIMEDPANVTEHNDQEHTSSGRHIVLIHDGARPFIRPDVISRIIEETEAFGAAIAAAPCTDTIKLIDDEGNITGTTERRLTWAAQTPQAFYLDEIYHAYNTVFGVQENQNKDTREADAGENGNNDVTAREAGETERYPLQSITDDAMVYQMVYSDRKIKVVDAGAENIKITAGRDLIVAEQLIKSIRSRAAYKFQLT